MAFETADEVYERVVKTLPVEEKRRLADQLLSDLERSPSQPSPRLLWRDIRGIVAYPLLEEDAQDWVSRTRRESDESRERQWKRERDA